MITFHAFQVAEYLMHNAPEEQRQSETVAVS
jgi:hypothetical protein